MAHKVLRTTVDVPILAGMETELEEKILSFGEQEYLFACSEERTILCDNQTLTLTIIWSESGPPDIEQWHQELKNFQGAISAFVEWEQAREKSQVITVLF